MEGRYINWIEPTAVDMGGEVTRLRSHAPGVYVFKTTEVVYAFSDSSGNVAFCNFTINVYRMYIIIGILNQPFQSL